MLSICSISFLFYHLSFIIRQKTFLFSLLFLAIINKIPAQVTPYKFNHLTVDNGLSHTDVTDINQDQLGFIWIATLRGLDRYDGYKVKNFTNKNDPFNTSFKNRIRSLYPDKDGNVWLLTEDGVQCFNSKTESFIKLRQQAEAKATHGNYKIAKLGNNKLILLSQDHIRCIKINGNELKEIPLVFERGIKFFDFTVDNTGNTWISSNNGIWVLNSRLELKHCKIIVDKNINTTQYFTNVTLTKKGSLVLIAGRYIVEIAQTTQEILRENAAEVYGEKRYQVVSGVIMDLLLDADKNCWISTNEGLIQLDDRWNHLQTITDKSQNNGLTTNYLFKMFYDKSGCLWLGSFGGGVNFADLNAKRFFLVQRNPELSNTLPANYIRSVTEEDQDNFWMGTNLNGLCRYTISTRQFRVFDAAAGAVKLRSNEVNALVFDKSKRLWVGSVKGIDVLNKERTHLEILPGEKGFPDFSIESLAVDFFGNIWFGSYGSGLGCIINENGIYKTVYYDLLQHKEGRTSDRINYIYCDKDRPEVFVSTTHGLNRLMIGNSGTIKTYIEFQHTGSENSISSNYVWPVQRQNDSVIWVGTLGGGLNKVVFKSNGQYAVTKYDGKQGVLSDVESLHLDEAGNVWIGGKGLQCFNPVSGSSVIYNANDGLQGNSFKVGSSFKGESGRLYFGGLNGLNYFYPAEIKKNTIIAAPRITGIEVNSRPLTYPDSSVGRIEIDSAVPFVKNLVLNYKQNGFMIFFSSMHFANPDKCTYRYKLEGFDKDWVYTNGTNPTVTYSNLNYRKYNFILEAANNDGLWSNEQAKLSIDVLPPWWKSGLAKLIYFALLSLFCYGVYLYLARWYNLKKVFAIRESEEKRKEELHRHQEELHQQQLQFFTNISHEFRTPLTLILGPVETILKNNNNPQISHQLEGVYRNAKRMLNLIAELMNFRKIADKAIVLQVSKLEIKDFVAELVDEFADIAVQKDICFTAELNGNDNVSFWADQQILEKVLNNLLNNSFKYTARSGQIYLEILDDISNYLPAYNNSFNMLHKERFRKHVYFLVRDNGIGISERSIKHIFDRYYRANDSHMGSGVGLALVKSLVELHKGDIYVHSESGRGTEFIVGIPIEKQNYHTDEISTDSYTPSQKQKAVIEKIAILQPFSEEVIIENSTYAKRKIPTILLVEDNDELKLFLKETLWGNYKILEASNGQTALDLIMQRKPDLIISDVMMPVMNGIDLCKVVKNTFETSHIPFILLTAKTNLESQLEGLGCGADYYLAKPFSIDFLLITIQNIFLQRQKLRELYAKGFYEDDTKLVQSDADKSFLQDLMSLIEDNLDSEELGVEFICRKLHSSRSSLYEKVQNITGKSIGDFIRSARLKKALDIMTHEDIGLQDLVQRVGLNSTSYFTRVFKKEFGQTPADFLRELKKRPQL